ncbi:hypothetical protein [Thioclava sp. SK-1]|uniref:hypothetical protein n=1 Tax=Thioclava sp. SK-1 TaxID=1889770 RepID=UPI00159EF5D9|nr:hypothetical protein [Thioclava sp. SK-1]
MRHPAKPIKTVTLAGARQSRDVTVTRAGLAFAALPQSRNHKQASQSAETKRFNTATRKALAAHSAVAAIYTRNTAARFRNLGMTHLPSPPHPRAELSPDLALCSDQTMQYSPMGPRPKACAATRGPAINLLGLATRDARFVDIPTEEAL